MPQPFLTATTTQADSTGLDPLYSALRDDRVENARNYDVRFLIVPRTTGTGDSYAKKEGSTEQTSLYNWVKPTALNLAGDVRYTDYQVARGAAARAEVEEGITTVNNFTVVDVAIVDESLNSLDTTLHDYADPSIGKTGQPILADALEGMRDVFHDQRKYNLPMGFCWAAQGESSTPGSTNATAIVVTSASYVNMIDTSVTSRTATSPGNLCPAYLAGQGPPDNQRGTDLNGESVALHCRVLGIPDGSNDCNIKFIGPTHVASNEVEITMTAGGILAWYGQSGGGSSIKLNTQSNDISDTTTARNKVDVHVKTAGGTAYIYGIATWYEYSNS
jgi:hypothetical protein